MSEPNTQSACSYRAQSMVTKLVKVIQYHVRSDEVARGMLGVAGGRGCRKWYQKAV